MGRINSFVYVFALVFFVSCLVESSESNEAPRKLVKRSNIPFRWGNKILNYV